MNGQLNRRSLIGGMIAACVALVAAPLGFAAKRNDDKDWDKDREFEGDVRPGVYVGDEVGVKLWLWQYAHANPHWIGWLETEDDKLWGFVDTNNSVYRYDPVVHEKVDTPFVRESRLVFGHFDRPHRRLWLHRIS